MGKLDMKDLEKKENLSEEDFQALQEEALAEETGKPAPDAEAEPKEQKEKGSEKQAEAEAEALKKRAEAVGLPEDASLEDVEAKEKEKPPEPSEAEKKEAEEKRKQEEERLLAAKEEDLNDEERAQRTELIKAKDEETKRIQAELDKEIADYASEHKVSAEEARTDLESRGKILEKYKGDPKQLAIANLHLQRLYSKTQEELKAVKEAKPAQAIKDVPLEKFIEAIEKGKIVVDGKQTSREGAIEAYRTAYPEVTESLDDEAVIKLAAKELKENMIRAQQDELGQVAIKAKDKRATLLNSLSEADKKFLPEIQAIVEKLPDAAIMKEDFSLVDTIRWAKGGVDLTKLEKEAEERGYKRGLEQAKILGIRETPAAKGGGKGAIKPKVTLTKEQEDRALQMYEGTEMTKEEKIAAFIEYEELDKEKPKDKK